MLAPLHRCTVAPSIASTRRRPLHLISASADAQGVQLKHVSSSSPLRAIEKDQDASSCAHPRRGRIMKPGLSAGKEPLFARRPPTQLPTSTTTLAAALQTPTKLSRKQQQFQKHNRCTFLQKSLASCFLLLRIIRSWNSTPTGFSQ
jgi:hypothetical protein